jgi:hypothetical protein
MGGSETNVAMSLGGEFLRSCFVENAAGDRERAGYAGAQKYSSEQLAVFIFERPRDQETDSKGDSRARDETELKGGDFALFHDLNSSWIRREFVKSRNRPGGAYPKSNSIAL